jgi:hypothetical protein
MKKQLFRICGWLLVAVAFAIPIAYSLSRLSNQAFLDDALGNWLATIVSVAAGVPLGLEVNRRIHQAELAAQAAREASELTKTRQTLLSQLEYELRENRKQIEGLQLAVKKSPKSRLDVWEWAERIAASFSYRVFDQIVESRSVTVSESNDLALAYAEIRSLQNYVLQAKAAHVFYHGYSGDITPADEMPEKVYWKTAHVLQVVEIAEKSRGSLLQAT